MSFPKLLHPNLAASKGIAPPPVIVTGKPITFTIEEFNAKYKNYSLDNIPQENKRFTDGDVTEVTIDNRLSFDVTYLAKELLDRTRDETTELFPKAANGNLPIVYYWVRYGRCSNLSCRIEIPLLRQFYLSKRRNSSDKDWIHFEPTIKEESVELDVKKGKYDEEEGYFVKRKLRCPSCGGITIRS